jgi:hypothetical protein
MRSNLRGNGKVVSFFAFQDIITSVIGIILFIALLLSLFMGIENATPEQSKTPRQQASAEAIARLNVLTVEIARLQALLRRAKGAEGAVSTVEIDLLKRELEDLRKQTAAFNPSADGSTDTASEIVSALAAIGTDAAVSSRELEEIQALAKAAAERVAELEKRLQSAQSAMLSEESKKNELFLIPETSGTTKSPILIDVARDSIQLHTLGGEKSAKRVAKSGELKDLLSDYAKTEYYIVAYFRPATFHLSKSITDELRSLGYEIGFDVIRDDQEIQFRPSNP